MSFDLNLWNFSSGLAVRSLATWSDETVANQHSAVIDTELHTVKITLKEKAFVLKTCQRTLVLSLEKNPFSGSSSSLPKHLHMQGQEAYLFLLETICGLKSKLIGENEIVGQFKESYKKYAASSNKDNRILLILEKLLQDSKNMRTRFLIGISHKTYASITRKHFIQKSRATHIVIIGSGSLAEDLINQFKKKAHITLCARNEQKVLELQAHHQFNVISWSERNKLFQHPFIANTVGTHEILFNHDFFQNWTNYHNNDSRLFVDLGSPSSIQTSLLSMDKVLRLDNIFQEGAVLEDEKEKQISFARNEMIRISYSRHQLFQKKFKTPPQLLSPQSVSPMRYT